MSHDFEHKNARIVRQKQRRTITCLANALDEARELYRLCLFAESFDLYEQIVEFFPASATSTLAEVYDCYENLPNKECRYSLYQARYFDFCISAHDRVLDIGSGNLPFPFATHLADIAIESSDVGRAGEVFKYLDGRVVYECNVESLPFADKEFDFICCSHVLEHVESPEKACRELMRVGKRGYIETPSRLKDMWLNTAKISNHRWAIELFDTRLIFTEYTPEDIEGLQSFILLDMHCHPQTDREKAFSALVNLKADKLNTMFYWEGCFEFAVRRAASS